MTLVVILFSIMKKPRPQKLSPGEMEMMNLLWQHGPLSIAEAHQMMASSRVIGYTTVQTRLNRLAEKGIVTRSDDRPATYAAAISPGAVSAGHLDQLVEHVAQGSVVPLVAHLLSDRKLSAGEIAELKRFIREAEKSSAG